MNHVLVCVEDVFSDPFRNTDFLGVASVVVHRGEELKPVFEPDLVIFLTVARRRVDATGPRLERDMFAQEDDRVTIEERMTAEPFFHFSSGKSSKGSAYLLPAGFLLEMVHQLDRHKQQSRFYLLRMTEFLNKILIGGMDRDGQVGRDSPWRGG